MSKERIQCWLKDYFICIKSNVNLVLCEPFLSPSSKAYAIGKKEKPPFIPQETPKPTAEEPVPNELVCLICHELLSDAVVIPCCGNSFCDDCESQENKHTHTHIQIRF